MAKKNNLLTNRNLGIALLVGLFIQFVFPAMGISGLGTLATIIYAAVAVILLIR